jgi:hypothetical protein
MNKQYLKTARAFEAKRGKVSEAEFTKVATKFTKWMMSGIAKPGGLLDLADKCEAVVKAMGESKKRLRRNGQ